jgi:hypothetical protein
MKKILLTILLIMAGIEHVTAQTDAPNWEDKWNAEVKHCKAHPDGQKGYLKTRLIMPPPKVAEFMLKQKIPIQNEAIKKDLEARLASFNNDSFCDCKWGKAKTRLGAEGSVRILGLMSTDQSEQIWPKYRWDNQKEEDLLAECLGESSTK